MENWHLSNLKPPNCFPSIRGFTMVSGRRSRSPRSNHVLWNSGNSHNQAIRNWNCNILRVLKFPVINFTDLFSDVIGFVNSLKKSGQPRCPVEIPDQWAPWITDRLAAVVEGLNCVQFTASFHFEKLYRKIILNYGKMSRGTLYGKEMQQMQAKSCLLG